MTDSLLLIPLTVASVPLASATMPAKPLRVATPVRSATPTAESLASTALTLRSTRSGARCEILNALTGAGSWLPLAASAAVRPSPPASASTTPSRHRGRIGRGLFFNFTSLPDAYHRAILQPVSAIHGHLVSHAKAALNVGAILPGT